MPMRYIILALSMLCFCSVGFAKEKKPKVDKVKTILKDAATAIKNQGGQDAVQARALKAVVREDVPNKQRVELYYTIALLDESMNDQENRKAYLKQKCDTARLFNTLLNMYDHLVLCDSVDHVPNSHGYAQPHYLRRTSSLRIKHRRNMLNGGKYYLIKSNYAQAYRFFDAYYQYRPDGDKTDLAKVVLWATECSYVTKNHNNTLRYVDEAIKASPDSLRSILQEYKCETFKHLGKDSLRLEALKEGVYFYPLHDYFFVNLVDYYHNNKRYEEGLKLCDTLITQYPDSALYWFAKSGLTLDMENFESTIVFADSAIHRKPDYFDAHYNRGMAYVKLAIIAQEEACVDIHNHRFASDRLHIRSLYRAALQSMQKVREHEPDNKDRWASALYRIYLNLNMGKEFDEIDKLMQK